MPSDLDRIDKELRKLYAHNEECMEKFDLCNRGVEDISKRLTQTDKSIDKILDLLTGNELDEKDNGILGEIRYLRDRIRLNDEKIAKQDKRLDRAFAFAIGLSFGAGWGFADLISKIFVK
jgi:chromosome segregation ATPase